MPNNISQKTRKVLWGNAAGRCSICNVVLFAENTSHTCIGEECHIISKEENGPRHQKGLDDYDNYDNLILLCGKHHKVIDDNPNQYPVEKLKKIKEEHEQKIKEDVIRRLEKQKKTLQIIHHIFLMILRRFSTIKLAQIHPIFNMQMTLANV